MKIKPEVVVGVVSFVEDAFDFDDFFGFGADTVVFLSEQLKLTEASNYLFVFEDIDFTEADSSSFWTNSEVIFNLCPNFTIKRVYARL